MSSADSLPTKSLPPLQSASAWAVGDAVTLKGTIYSGEWPMTVRGIYRGRDPGTDESQFFFHWDYLNEVMKMTSPERADTVGVFVETIDDPDGAAEVGRGIDGLFRNSLAETMTETEKAFQMSFVAMTGTIVAAIRIVSYVVIVIIMVVAANTMAMTARERIPEYATMKTLGFGARHIAVAIFGESVRISLAGGLLGVALSFPAGIWIEHSLKQFFPAFAISTLTIVLDLVALLIVGTVAALFRVWRGTTINVAEGLRRIG